MVVPSDAVNLPARKTSSAFLLVVVPASVTISVKPASLLRRAETVSAESAARSMRDFLPQPPSVLFSPAKSPPFRVMVMLPATLLDAPAVKSPTKLPPVTVRSVSPPRPLFTAPR